MSIPEDGLAVGSNVPFAGMRMPGNSGDVFVKGKRQSVSVEG